jgi:microcystin-dependent protein
MTSHNRQRRTSSPTQVFTALEPGEFAVNTANRQVLVGDAASSSIGVPLPLLGVRIFDSRGIYAADDYVVYSGVLYRAKATTTPGFDPAQWDAVAGQATGGTSPYVLRTGDTMTGHLALPPTPGPAQAVRKDYVDNALTSYATVSYVTSAIAPFATTTYVDTQDAKAVPKAGGTMTGALTLSGPPTVDLHASTKAYVDSKGSGIPPGAIMDFAVPTTPAGWLPCDGQQVSRTTYAALFAVVGTFWGAGDGSTTFTLPNFRSRFRRHRDDNSNFANTVGTLQGHCNMTHTHGININSGYQSADHAHYTSGTTQAADRSLDHTHGGVPVSANGITAGSFIAPTINASYFYTDHFGFSGGMDRSIDHLHTFGAWSGGVNTNHYHNIAGNTAGGSADNANEARPYSATVLTCIKV